MQIDPGLERLSKNAEIALFRIVQESLSNVYRHSGSATAKVRLTLESGEIILEVSDQGKGFSADAWRGGDGVLVSPGVGITGMRERMRQIGGRLEITPGAGGTTVKAMVPLDAAQLSAEPPVKWELDGLVFPTPEPADRK